MKISIECTGSDFVELDQLEPLQGELKSLAEEDYQKIKKSILELGFSFPIFVWKDAEKNYIIDAHQRVITLKKLRDEGYEIPKLPVVFISAKDRKDASKKILAASSQYGVISPDSLHKFVIDFGLDMNELFENFKFPEIHNESFLLAFSPGYKNEKFDANKEWNNMPSFDQENAKPLRTILVHFYTEEDIQKFSQITGLPITDKTKYLYFPDKVIEVAKDKRWTT